MTQLVKIIIAVIGILALYGLWTLVMSVALDYLRQNAPARRVRARDLAERAVTQHQHLAGANRYFNNATQTLDAPYASLVNQARELAKSGYEVAGRAVKSADMASRFNWPQNPRFYRFMVVPPLLEVVARFRHALVIRRVEGQLVSLQDVRRQLAAIDAEIAAQGQQLKNSFDALRKQANELETRRQSLVSPSQPLVIEGVSLAGVFSSLDMINNRLLANDNLPRQNVIEAYRWLIELREIVNEVEQKMRQRPSPELDATFALQVALRYFSRLEQALAASVKLYGPFPNLSAQLPDFQKKLDEINAVKQSRDYQIASGQAQTLTTSIQAQLETLEQLRLLRASASEMYSQAQYLTADYEAKLAATRLTYEMDVSDPLLQDAGRFVHELDDLRLSEDLVNLGKAGELKHEFDVKMGLVENVHKAFELNATAYADMISRLNRASVNEQCSRAVQQAEALAMSHVVYSQSCPPDALQAQSARLQAEWLAVADHLEKPKQSQLESLLKTLAYPLRLQAELTAANEAVAASLAQKEADHRAALASMREIDTLLPECKVLAQNWDQPSIATSASYQARRDELSRELGRPETDKLDYTTLRQHVEALQSDLHGFIKAYADRVADLQQRIATLHERFEPVVLQLQDLQSSVAPDLQVDRRFSNDIQAWQTSSSALTSDAPLRELQATCDAGNRLLVDSLSYTQRLKLDRDSFIQFHKHVDEHAVRVRDQIAKAAESWRKTQTDGMSDRPDRVAPIRLQLDKASAMLARLNEPSAKYTLANGLADLKLADSQLDYADLMLVHV
ncbi:MAG TPA: hypothetical protein VGK87_06065 [Anaerolineae bacterium]